MLITIFTRACRFVGCCTRSRSPRKNSKSSAPPIPPWRQVRLPLGSPRKRESGSKYGFDVEPILVSGGARAVPALIGNSVQFLIGSDTGVTTAQLQGIPVVRLGVTMNTLGSSLITQPSIQSVQDLKGKILGISRGRDASYMRLGQAAP